MSLELLGAAHVGDGLDLLGPILKATGEIADTGIKYAQQKQASDKASGDEQAKLNAAIAADAKATGAAATAKVSGDAKGPTAADDAATAATLASAAQRAGANLSSASQSKRADAAQQGLSTANALLQKNPKNPYYQALVAAWNQTINRANNAAIVAPDAGGGGKGKKGKGDDDSGGSWLDGKTGPVPNKAIAGAGVLAVGAVLAKKFLFH